jgi:toxin FitB
LKFLLDTNVVSEWVKPRPNEGVVSWLANIDEASVFISVITLMELRYGIEYMPAGVRRTRLDTWLRGELPRRFDERIMQVDSAVADTCGSLMARSKRSGHAMDAMDAFIGATAMAHGLGLVTRNVADFRFLDGIVINPWDMSSD